MISKILDIFRKKQPYTPHLLVDKPINGRRLVIPDIHGCYQTFEKLLNRVQLTKADQLFLLGDFISRGKSSAKVLDMIIQLQDEKFQVFALRGNHEQMILDCAKERAHELSWFAEKFKLQDLLTRNNKLKTKYHKMMNSLYYVIELDEFFLVHAGFNITKEFPLKDFDSMLWIEEPKYDSKKLNNKRVIRGHKTQPLFKIENQIAKNEKIISLDNGCVYLNQKPRRGHLLCLDIDSNELIKEKKIRKRLATTLKSAILELFIL